MAKKLTSVEVLRTLLVQGGELEQIVKNAKQKFDKRGQKTNTVSKPITEANLQRLCKAMLRDISSERKGWWSNFKIEEEQNQVKIVEKK